MLQDLFVLQQEHQLLFLFYTFFVALCVGSFLNVVIYRLPEMMQREWRHQAKFILAPEDEHEALQKAFEAEEKFNLSVPASTCPSCKSGIKPWQNIPVVSYLFLRGKCGSCKAPISMRYPAIELLTALMVTLVYCYFGYSLQGLSLMFLTFCFVALFWIDVDHQLLPDSITLPILWLGLLLNSAEVFVPLQEAVFGAAAGYLSLWSVYWAFKLLRGKEGMGYGDFKLMAVVGAWFGWQVLPQVIMVSSLVGVLWAVLSMFMGKQQFNKPMPFGPFIILAAYIVAIFEKQLTQLLSLI